MSPLARQVTVWLVASGAAVAVAWTGIGLVTAQVAAPPATIELVGATAPARDRVPDATPSPTDATTAAETDDGEPDEDAHDLADGPATSGGATSAAGDDDPDDDATTAAPEPEDDDPAPAAGLDETRTVEAVGGTARFRFTDGAVEVVFATPAQGFSVAVERDAPDDVRVTFERDDHESRIDAEFDDGAPRVRVDEDADD